jgi:hypothetical protein
MPTEWRAAVDAATGRTYWYHRKTRQSTWECPVDFQDENSTDGKYIGKIEFKIQPR